MVEVVRKEASTITLKLDQLDESITLLEKCNSMQDEHKNVIERLFDEWNWLKKLAKDANETITLMFDNKFKTVPATVLKLDEELAVFNQSMRTKNYHTYASGVDRAKAELEDAE